MRVVYVKRLTSTTIKTVKLRKVIDAHAKYTIEADVLTEGGGFGRSTAPLGAAESRSMWEAQAYPLGGIDEAVKKARNEIASRLIGMDAKEQKLVDQTLREIDGTLITPDALPYKLEQNSTKTFTCPWNWTHYRGKDVLVSIFTAQNYTIRYAKATPPPIEVISAIFNPADTNSFNVTVHNSAFYYSSVNITNITLTFENGTVKEINGTTVAPQLPYVLAQDSSATFRALWNWANYQGKNVTITVGTAENYTAQLVKVTPKRVFLTIASISFDSVDTSVFNVMVRNSALSLESASITRVTVTFENGTVREVSNVVPSLPYLLSPNSTTTFTCQWDWTSYRGKNITITIYTEKGYATSSLYTTPPLQ